MSKPIKFVLIAIGIVGVGVLIFLLTRKKEAPKPDVPHVTTRDELRDIVGSNATRTR